MNWEKKGLIYVPDGTSEWSKTHAQVPVADIHYPDRWRIYYSTRNSRSESSISFIDVEKGNPSNILYAHDKPILSKGRLGTFDDSGLMPTCIVDNKGIKYLYTIGWMLRSTIPYHNSIGIAISEDGGRTFNKPFDGPILSTSRTEPYFCGTAFVFIENEIWRMWYLSCTHWEIINGRPEPFYHIKYAESKDGIEWKRDGIVAIDYLDESEAGLVSASVVKDGPVYRMWFGYRKGLNYRTDRNQSYKIGYAESKDGIIWNRMDELAGIGLSDEGWDNQMISYPYVIEHEGFKYMFYNGNGFGTSGFGYATSPIQNRL